jgi:protein-S-isoprenylcysteine O-methyltransferase Ste14
VTGFGHTDGWLRLQLEPLAGHPVGDAANVREPHRRDRGIALDAQPVTFYLFKLSFDDFAGPGVFIGRTIEKRWRAASAKRVLMPIRHLISIVVLPGTVAVAVPIWIARRQQVRFAVPMDAQSAIICTAGLTLLAAGGFLFGWSLYYFWSRGRGTLAPWDPPRAFVVDGPYRYVRNPMISGVLFILIGEAGVLRSASHLAWAAVFSLINAIYIPLFEEPMLEARFGDPYRHYTRTVRRFLPRLRPSAPERNR